MSKSKIIANYVLILAGSLAVCGALTCASDTWNRHIRRLAREEITLAAENAVNLSAMLRIRAEREEQTNLVSEVRLLEVIHALETARYNLSTNHAAR